MIQADNLTATVLMDGLEGTILIDRVTKVPRPVEELTAARPPVVGKTARSQTSSGKGSPNDPPVGQLDALPLERAVTSDPTYLGPVVIPSPSLVQTDQTCRDPFAKSHQLVITECAIETIVGHEHTI